MYSHNLLGGGQGQEFPSFFPLCSPTFLLLMEECASAEDRHNGPMGNVESRRSTLRRKNRQQDSSTKSTDKRKVVAIDWVAIYLRVGVRAAKLITLK